VSFVDTNVLVYATARSAPFRDRSRAALSRLAAREPLAVSRQILREYIAVMTRQQIWGRL
jgi:predicted nucleic acid-binding protein